MSCGDNQDTHTMRYTWTGDHNSKDRRRAVYRNPCYEFTRRTSRREDKIVFNISEIGILPYEQDSSVDKRSPAYWHTMLLPRNLSSAHAPPLTFMQKTVNLRSIWINFPERLKTCRYNNFFILLTFNENYLT